ncbi:MAG: adenosine kinase, partial [Proteobacteria bacterium]|nr:adenosine kinase [Pseudomonadota bacterium]
MKAAKYDVIGVGNAIVDVLSFAEDSAVSAAGLQKGSMTLVDEATSLKLYGGMGTTTECSGGSVANSLAGLASLGANCAFIGKVKTDQLGGIFTHDMRAVGVHFASQPMDVGPATANCLIFVTPDAQRTMATFIGACGHVSESDIDAALIEDSAILYIEGYLWDLEAAKAAIRKSIRIARAAGRKVAFTLSDTFCVQRHRAEFLQLISGEVDILFANEAEIKSLYETENFEEA